MTPRKTIFLDEMKDEFIGKKGSLGREEYEYEFELNMEVLGLMIKKARKERQLTQDGLGKLVGVQKAQTIIKVFKALKPEIHFNVVMENKYLQIP